MPWRTREQDVHRVSLGAARSLAIMVALSTFAAITMDATLALAAAPAGSDEPRSLPPFPEPLWKDGDLPGPLDPRRLHWVRLYELGLPFFRGVHHDTWKTGVFDLTVGQEMRTDRFPFYLMSTRASTLRMYDDKSYALSIFQDVGGGVALGPFEPEVHAGAHLIELDVFHANWNISTLSPRASAELGVRVGRARVELVLYTQYLWRWFGESQLIQGVALGVQVDPAKPRPR